MPHILSYIFMTVMMILCLVFSNLHPKDIVPRIGVGMFLMGWLISNQIMAVSAQADKIQEEVQNIKRRGGPEA